VEGDNPTAVQAANDAIAIHDSEPPSRFRNRIDPDFEIAAVLAVCHTVLGLVAVEAGDAEGGAKLLSEADRLRAEVGAPVPKFQASDLERARGALAVAE
jgi:hypothetical protein